MVYVTKKQYLAADSATRKAMLYRSFNKHCYNPGLTPLIASEDVEFICKISKKMLESYRYLFSVLLCEIARKHGIDAVGQVIKASKFTQAIEPIELSEAGLRIHSDSNPLASLYAQEGPQAFVELYRMGAVDLRSLYLWLYASSKDPHSGWDFILAIAEAYASDKTQCVKILLDLFQVEYDLAQAQHRPWQLNAYAELFSQLCERLPNECFYLFLRRLYLVLVDYESPETMAGNLIYLDFLEDLVVLKHPIGDPQTLDYRFWRWIAYGHQRLLDTYRLL